MSRKEEENEELNTILDGYALGGFGYEFTDSGKLILRPTPTGKPEVITGHHFSSVVIEIVDPEDAYGTRLSINGTGLTTDHQDGLPPKNTTITQLTQIVSDPTDLRIGINDIKPLGARENPMTFIAPNSTVSAQLNPNFGTLEIAVTPHGDEHVTELGSGISEVSLNDPTLNVLVAQAIARAEQATKTFWGK